LTLKREKGRIISKSRGRRKKRDRGGKKAQMMKQPTLGGKGGKKEMLIWKPDVWARDRED